MHAQTRASVRGAAGQQQAGGQGKHKHPSSQWVRHTCQNVSNLSHPDKVLSVFSGRPVSTVLVTDRLLGIVLYRK